jgi:hypothetical protein
MNTFLGVFGLAYFAIALFQIATAQPWPTRQVWYAANILLVVFTPYEGYISMAPEKLGHTNPDVVFCAFILLITPLFSIGAVYYSVHRWKHDKLRRPSWDRNALNWWHDPLQSLFMLTCLTFGTAVGGALRRPDVNSVAFWTLGMYICFALGLSLGQILVYRIFRGRIIAAIP